VLLGVLHGGLQDAEFGLGFGEEALQILDDVMRGVEFQVAAGGHQVMSAHLDRTALNGVGLSGGGGEIADFHRVAQRLQTAGDILFEKIDQFHDHAPAAGPCEVVKIFRHHPARIDHIRHRFKFCGG